MPRKRRAAREFRLKHKALTPSQEMELLIGPFAIHGTAFGDEDTRRRAWFDHRAELMLLLPPDGRGWGWIMFEGGGFRPNEGGRITAALARIDEGKPHAEA